MGVRTARPSPLVIPELMYASEAQEAPGVELNTTDSCGQGAEVNGENQVNEEEVGVTSAESEGTPLRTSEKIPTCNSIPTIWVSAGSDASWEALSSELMDICRQGDVWLEDEDEWSSGSSSELMDICRQGDIWFEEADGWSSGSSSGYETGSDAEEQQTTAATGCKENHHLEYCGMFKGWTHYKQVAYLKDQQLCLYCRRHHQNQDCFAKNRPDYKGCGICGEHHHTDYHYMGVAVNRLFQLHVKVESYEEGLEVFELRENLHGRSGTAATSPLMPGATVLW